MGSGSVKPGVGLYSRAGDGLRICKAWSWALQSRTGDELRFSLCWALEVSSDSRARCYLPRMSCRVLEPCCLKSIITTIVCISGGSCALQKSS